MTDIKSLAKQRRLHIIDDVKSVSDLDRKIVERLHVDKLGAERVIFSDEASFSLGQWIAGCEDIMFDNIQFALPPFPKTYVELTLWRVHMGIDRHTSGPMETADDRFGFLICGNHVRTVVTSRTQRRAAHGAFEYWMNTPDPYRLMDGYIEREMHWRSALLMGSSQHALEDSRVYDYILHGTRINCTILDKRTAIERVTHPRYGLLPRLCALMVDCAGEMRTLWAALLMLNQHKDRIQSHAIPRQAMITPHGRKVYLAHTLIHIPISYSPEQMRKTFYPNTRASPVGHRVRAHWRDYHTLEDCTKSWQVGMKWPILPDNDGRFQCPNCGGYRRRIENFHRGRSDSGYNIHTYEVTP